MSDETRGMVAMLPPAFGDAEIDALVAHCRDVFRAKGKDYTIGTGDALHNFRTVGEFLGVDPAQAWAVYFYKHIAAIFAYAKHGAVESEPIEGRIVDAINYLLLFHKLVLEGQRKGDVNGKDQTRVG